MNADSGMSLRAPTRRDGNLLSSASDENDEIPAYTSPSPIWQKGNLP
jgi:hypothetical protein